VAHAGTAIRVTSNATASRFIPFTSGECLEFYRGLPLIWQISGPRPGEIFCHEFMSSSAEPWRNHGVAETLSRQRQK
jgi:hypothetical protein